MRIGSPIYNDVMIGEGNFGYDKQIGPALLRRLRIATATVVQAGPVVQVLQRIRPVFFGIEVNRYQVPAIKLDFRDCRLGGVNKDGRQKHT